MASNASALPVVQRVSASPATRSLALALGLAGIFVTITGATWARWGHVAIDCGGSLDRAARIAEGAFLYRDVLDPYGPVGSYAIGGLFRLFGIHLEVAYAAGLVLLLIESALLWYVCRPFLSALECALGLVGFWVLFGFQPGILNWVLPNTFAATFGAFFATATAAALVADARHPGWRPLVAASTSAALAGLSKVEFGAAAAGTAVVYALLPVHALRGRLRMLVTALLPGFLLVAAVALVFLALVPWRQLLFDNVYRIRSFTRSVPTYNAWILPPLWPLVGEAALRYCLELPARAAGVAAGLSLMQGGGARRAAGVVLAASALLAPLVPGYPALRDFGPEGRAPYRQFGWTHVGWLIVAIVALVRLHRRNSVAARALVVVGTLCGLMSLRWGFHIAWASFYAFFAPFLVILLVRTIAAHVTEGAAAGTALVIALAIGTAAHAYWPRYAWDTFTLDYPRGRIRTSPFAGPPMAATIAYLRAHTAPEDYVAVIPEERLINFLAERRFPTPDPGLGPGWLATPADEARFVAELEAKRTEVIVLSSRIYLEFRAGGVGSYNPAVKRYIERAYREEWRSGPYVVYRRAPPEVGGARQSPHARSGARARGGVRSAAR